MQNALAIGHYAAALKCKERISSSNTDILRLKFMVIDACRELEAAMSLKPP